MYETVTIHKLSTGSIFKLIAVGSLCSVIPLSIFFGFFALFGASTITWNNQPITGFTGLAASPFIGLLVSIICTAFLGLLVAFGLWIFSKFSPIQIDIKRHANGSQPK